jgi:hypothetical protein
MLLNLHFESAHRAGSRDTYFHALAATHRPKTRSSADAIREWTRAFRN